MGGKQLMYTDKDWHNMHSELINAYKSGKGVTEWCREKGFTKSAAYTNFARLGLPTSVRKLCSGQRNTVMLKPPSKFVQFVPAGGEGSKIEVICGNVRVLVDSSDTEGLKTAIMCCKEMENS